MDHSASSSWRDYLPTRRGAAAFVLAGLIIVIGFRIPIYGIDLATYFDGQYENNGYASRISVLALGVMPLMSVLMIAEIAKLVFPQIVRWRGGSERSAHIYDVIIAVFALTLAGFQAYGVLVGLEYSSLLRPDVAGFRVVGIASFVGAAAIMIWLAFRIRVRGFENGFWLLLAVLVLFEAPAAVAGMANMFLTGAVGWQVALWVGLMIAITALAVFANLAISYRNSAMVIDKAIPASFIVWPPFLASYLASFILALVMVFISSDQLSNSGRFGMLMFATMPWLSALLAPLILYLYARRAGLTPAKGADGAVTPILTLIAVTQMLVLVVPEMFFDMFGLPTLFGGAIHLALVTVIMSLRRNP